MSHLFGIGTTRQTKCWEQNFALWVEKMGPEGTILVKVDELVFLVLWLAKWSNIVIVDELGVDELVVDELES